MIGEFSLIKILFELTILGMLHYYTHIPIIVLETLVIVDHILMAQVTHYLHLF